MEQLSCRAACQEAAQEAVRAKMRPGVSRQRRARTFHIVVRNDQVDGQAHCRQRSIAGAKLSGQSGRAGAGQNGLVHLAGVAL